MSDDDKTGISVLQIICLFGVWAVVQVALKLVGVINWSWWWVTMPIWGMAIVAVLFLLFLIVCAVVYEIASHR